MFRAKRPIHDRTRLAAAAGLCAVVGVTTAAVRRWNRIGFRDRVVVITGGSRGLGLVLAKRLAREGAALALLARDEDELRIGAAQVAALGGAVLVIPCDVTDSERVQRAIGEVAAFFGRIDIVINNAGVMQVGPMEHMTEKDFEQAWRLHVWAPLQATLAALPHMRRAGGGRIVNIASIGGRIAIPHMLPYTVSKFALVGLSDGLRAELRRDNILVTTVCPGTMRIGSARNATFKGDHRAEHAWFAVSGSLPGLSVGVERAARQIVRAARYGRPSLVVGVPAKLGVLLNAVTPNLMARLTAWVNRLLPDSQPAESSRGRKGWQSGSRWAPSFLTRLADRAAHRHNETFKESGYATALTGHGRTA